MKLKSVLLTAFTAFFAMNAMAEININTASADEFKLLKNIGKKKAEAIVAYRNEHGEFASVDDLEKVKGISKKMIATLKEDLTVTGETDLTNLKNQKSSKNKSTKKSDQKAVKTKKEKTGKASAAKTAPAEEQPTAAPAKPAAKAAN